MANHGPLDGEKDNEGAFQVFQVEQTKVLTIERCEIRVLRGAGTAQMVVQPFRPNLPKTRLFFLCQRTKKSCLTKVNFSNKD